LTKIISSLSKELDITGITEIHFLDDMNPNIAGEMVVNSLVPSDYTIKLRSSILYKEILNNKQEVNNFINTLKHELCHVHDHNKLQHIYKTLIENDDTIDYERVSLLFAKKTWSEFIATYLSSDTSSTMIIEDKINALNDMCKNLYTIKKDKNTELLGQVFCCMAYVIGDILNKENLAEKLRIKIDARSFTPILQMLYDELKSLLKSYPNWNDVTYFIGIKDIFQTFVMQCKSE